MMKRVRRITAQRDDLKVQLTLQVTGDARKPRGKKAREHVMVLNDRKHFIDQTDWLQHQLMLSLSGYGFLLTKMRAK